MICLHCGRPLEASPSTKRRHQKRFCNGGCRSSYFQAQKRGALKAAVAHVREAADDLAAAAARLEGGLRLLERATDALRPSEKKSDKKKA